MKESMAAAAQLVEVTPVQVYLLPPVGDHLPPLSCRNRQHSGVFFGPTCWGECMPFAVQLSTPRILSTSDARSRLPPRASAWVTKSRAADQAKTPKKDGLAPGFTCCRYFR